VSSGINVSFSPGGVGDIGVVPLLELFRDVDDIGVDSFPEPFDAFGCHGGGNPGVELCSLLTDSRRWRFFSRRLALLVPLELPESDESEELESDVLPESDVLLNSNECNTPLDRGKKL